MAFWNKKNKEEEEQSSPGEPEKPVSFSAEPDDDFWGEANLRGVFRRFSRGKEPVGPEAPQAPRPSPPMKPEEPVVLPSPSEKTEEPSLLKKEPSIPGAKQTPPLEEPAKVETAGKRDFTFEGEVKKAEAEAKAETEAASKAEAPRVVEKPVAPKREKRPRREMPVGLQMPDEYEGMVTESPSYLKAVLWGLLAGAVGAGAYAGLSWWRHREYGIIGWLMGITVGLVVVYASGRHFNWKLGLIAAGISMFFLSAGRILVYMLDVRFPDIIKLPIKPMDNFHHALTQFVKQLPTTWLVFLLITGGVAFLVSFRPWPVRLKTSGSEEAPSQAPPA